MNDRDIEERLRDVVRGSQPPAPQSLHHFLHDLPETEVVHHHGPIGRLRSALDRLPNLAPQHPYARRAQMGFGVAMAVVIGAAGAGLLLNLRNSPSVPSASSSPGQTGPWVTPRRSTGTHGPLVQASLNIQGIHCYGVPSVDNESMALPTVAVVTSSGKYLGVTGGAFGSPGLVHSADGIFWDWSPPTEVDPHATVVTSIATDENSTIVVTGGVQGVDGTTDGRIWTSKDDGVTWRENNDEAAFEGVTVQLVTYSPGRWLALGWSSNTAPDSRGQIAAWMSDDGQTWTHVSTPIKGNSALIMSTAAGFILSGTPLGTGAINEPPIWHSLDGQTWTRSTADDNAALLMGPLTSATVTGLSHIYAVSTAPDGATRALVASYDGGLTWRMAKPDDSLPDASMISHVASLIHGDPGVGGVELLIATIGTGRDSSAHIMVSKDGGVSWIRLIDTKTGGPAGTNLLDLGHGWQAGGNKVLSFGDPGSGVGIWLTEAQ
ncbi:MAG TPA: sialidase family protein [Candidatus Limnocylindrales bacterium]